MLRKIRRAIYFCLYALLTLWLMDLPGLALAQTSAPTCQLNGHVVGRGVKIVRVCTAGEPGFDKYDAYYRVAIDVTPGQGFNDQARFRERSAMGQTLSGFLSVLADAERATVVDISVSIRQGATQYPPLSLLTFRKTSDNEWTSFLRGDARSFYHRLNDNEPFVVQVTYTYSRRTNFDLSVGANLLQNAGVGTIATESSKAIISAANTVITSVLRINDIQTQSGYEFSISPAVDRNISAEFQIVDPRTGGPIASMRLRLEGARSLLASPREWPHVAGTLPSGLVAMPTLNNLSRQIATGPAQSWDLVNGALASSSLDSAPLGREPTRQDIENLCANADRGLRSSYSLTDFDRLLVRGALLEITTRSIRSRINPYRICFPNDIQRVLLRTHLDLPTEIDPVVAPDLSPLTDFESLIAMACHFSGREGEYCGTRAANRAKVEALSAERISIAALEVSNPRLFDALPTDRIISRANFLDRFAAQFLQFGDLASSSGSFRIRESADGPWLVLTAEQSPDRKLSRIAIRRAP